MSLTIKKSVALTGPTQCNEISDWFDPRHYLGRRGTSLLPRSVQLCASAAHLLEARDVFNDVPPDLRGLWTCTTTFAEQQHQEMDEVVRTRSADALSPVRAPYFSVNLVGSRISQDLQIQGHVMVMTSPTTGLVDAFAAANHAIQSDGCSIGIISCVEVGHPDPEGSVAFLVGDGGEGSPLGGWARGFLPRDAMGDPSAIGLARLETSLDKLAENAHGPAIVGIQSAPNAVQQLVRQYFPVVEEMIGDDERLLPQALALSESTKAGHPVTVISYSETGMWSTIQFGEPL